MASKAQRGHLRLVETSDGERAETAEDRDLRPSQPGDGRASVPSDVPHISMRVPSRPDADELGVAARGASLHEGAEAETSPLPIDRDSSHAHLHAVHATPAAQAHPTHAAHATNIHKSSRLATRGPLANLPDAQLVALGCKGESGAFELLYRRHVSFALHLATRIEGSSRDVEDIVHDAFLRAFERINDLTDRGAFKSWLGAIVVHAVRSRMRRHRLMNLLGIGRKSEPVDLDSVMSPDASPHTRAQVAQIYALLRTLSADDRIAWTLRCVEGHDLDSVAKLTRCSLATVKRRISRAQQFLDEHFIDSAKEDLS